MIKKLIQLFLLTPFAVCADGVSGHWMFSPGFGILHQSSAGKQLSDVGSPRYATFRVGYDWDSSRWALESGVWLAPKISDKNLSRIGGGYLDGLFHISKFSRLDPYAAFGVGYAKADERGAFTSGSDYSVSARVGIGLMWHISQAWSLRADARYNVGVTHPSATFGTFELGLVYHFDSKDKHSIDELPEAWQSIPLAIEFADGLSLIKPSQYETLDVAVEKVWEIFKDSPEMKATLFVMAENQTLAEDRAMRIMEYFIDMGIPVAKLKTKGTVGKPTASVVVHQ